MLIQVDANPPGLGWAQELFLTIVPEGKASPGPVQAPGKRIMTQTASVIRAFTCHLPVSHPNGDLWRRKKKMESRSAHVPSVLVKQQPDVVTQLDTGASCYKPWLCKYQYDQSLISLPCGQSTPPPSSKGSSPKALCRELVSRNENVLDGQVGSGSQPSAQLYDLHLTAADGDRLCSNPWWVRT